MNFLKSGKNNSLRSNKLFVFPGFGASTLLVVFLSLCLCLFAVLSLSTARRGLKLSETRSERQRAWYAASDEAEHKAAELDKIIAEALNADGTSSDNEALAKALAPALPSDCVYDIDTRTISFSVQIDDKNVLAVSLAIDEGPVDTHRYTVTEWKSVPVSDWTPGSNSTLYDPEN